MVGTVMTGPSASRFSILSYFGSPSGQSESPAIIMDHDADVIRVVEGCRAAIESGIVEPPPRRCELPNELREVAPVFFVTQASALRGKIELIQPFELGLRRQRHLAGFLAAHQVT